jgi:hypothetical protein
MTIPPQKNPLRRQLDAEKYLHAAVYVQNSAGGLKKLSSNELAYLNQLVGDIQGEPWRFSPTHVSLPNGQIHQFNVISNPLSRGREIIGDAYQIAANEDPVSGACFIYAQLVLEHLFTGANRRTAALAALWLLQANGLAVDAQKLLDVKVGDLRIEADLQEFKQAIRQLTHK